MKKNEVSAEKTEQEKMIQKVVSDFLEVHNITPMGGRWEEWSIKRVIDLSISGELSAEAVYQRSAPPAWGEHEKIVDVFESVMADIGFGVLTVNKVGKMFFLMDGGNRKRWCNLVYAGYPLYAGFTLQDNPAVLEAFLAKKVRVLVFENLDDSQAGDIFARLNGGAAMSVITRDKTKLSSITTNPLFTTAVTGVTSIMTTKKEVSREKAEEVCLQAFSLLAGSLDFTAKNLVKNLSSIDKVKAGELLTVLVSNIASVRAWLIKDDKKDLAGITKKAFINVLLGQAVLPSPDKLAKFLRGSLVSPSLDGFKEASRASSASPANVSIRSGALKMLAGVTSETNTSETNTSETSTSETNTSETSTSETNTSETNTSETNTKGETIKSDAEKVSEIGRREKWSKWVISSSGLQVEAWKDGRRRVYLVEELIKNGGTKI